MGVKMTEDSILEALKAVEDPDLHKNIVELGFVKNINIKGSKISFDVELTTPACPVKDQLKEQCYQIVSQMDGVDKVDVNMTAQVRQSMADDKKIKLAGVKNVIAVASGKGGVGKSTTAVNIAVGLHILGARVGILDADIYGPSLPMMLGVNERPKVDKEQHLYPLKAHGIEVISMGFLSDDTTPVIWRGPMVGGVIQQFLNQVIWDDVDYLIIDLPPGTGDAQLTLCQRAPLTGAVIVSTPQEVSLLDARKGLLMFEKVQVPILGLVETMSYFVCDSCDKKHSIFSQGGGKRISEKLNIPLLGEVPIELNVCIGGDEGKPIVVKEPESDSAKAYMEIAKQVASQVSTLQFAGAGPDLTKLTLNWKT